MIVLTFPIASAQPRLIQPGFAVRGARGTVAGQVVLPGACYAIEAHFPPMRADDARKLQADLEMARVEGLRIKVPLAGVSQGLPGSPVVDGGGASGTALPLRGLTPGYGVKKGFWLTVIDAGGNRCLHRVAEAVVAGSDGKAVLTLVTPLRTVLVDGDAVLLAVPTMDGVVTSEVSWSIPPGGVIGDLGFTIEEAEAA